MQMFEKTFTEKCCGGYTLIELVAVISIISLMTAVLVPFCDRAVSGYELKTAARTLASDIRYGENKALTEEKVLKIRFFPSNNEYRTYFHNSDAMKYRSVKFSPRIDLRKTNFNNDTILFNNRGTVIQGGTVTLKGKYGRWLYVKIQPITGRVNIDDKP